MRLINADKLVEQLEESNSYHANNAREQPLLDRTVQIVQEQKTAYDADKVVEELKHEMHNYYPSIDDYCLAEKAVKLSDAITIVKGGGINDRD